MTSPTPVFPSRFVSPELLARGGMADVYLAQDASLGRPVAIKLLDDRFAADEELRSRFVREARVAAGLSGARNVVTVYDVGELASGRPYMVMEYLAGGSVADRLQEGAIAPAQALEWLEQAARGLDAAHTKGIVHRDVKPGNLMLSSEGEVQVADFGIAHAAGDGALTITGTILGTSGYMAPEQAMGGRATPASDRYGLAVVAFELLTGRRPFVAESQVTEAMAHVNAPIPSATSVKRELPVLVDPVLAHGLAKEPAKRYESCGRLVGALRQAFHDSAEETRRLTPVPSVAAPVAASSRPRWIPALVAVALLVGSGIAFASLVSRGDSIESVQTIVRTQTVAGEAQTRTVTVFSQTTVQAPATPQADDTVIEQPQSESGFSGAALNDQGYRLLQDGDVESALPLLERSVQLLAGTGSTVEAYASYNLAVARYSLGRCDGVLALLDRSEQVQGKRREINRLRKDAGKGCSDDGDD